ncbi:DUF4189 domain-containing protein [Xanthomonas sp. 60]
MKLLNIPFSSFDISAEASVLRAINAKIALSILLAVVSPSAFAQYQPGSTGYNTVVVPGAGISQRGDRRTPNRWGALSLGLGGKFGWTINAESERQAKKLANQDCARSGGNDCRVETTFVNTCAALALGEEDWTIYYDSPENGPLETVEAEAVKRCGSGCQIARSGCSIY